MVCILTLQMVVRLYSFFLLKIGGFRICRDVPAGVLYDLFVPEHDEEPWNLILHVTDYPYSTLPPYFGENTIKSYMFNSLKEASFVALGTAAKVNFMVSAAKDDMWQAVTNGALQMYRNILESIGFTRDMFIHNTRGGEEENEPEDSESSLSQHGTNGGRSKKHIPLRLYAKKSGEYLSSYADVLRVSTRVPAYKSTGEPTTLKDALIHRLDRWLDLTNADRNNAQHHVDKDEAEEQNAAVLTRIAKVIVGGLSFTSKDIMEGNRGTDICGLHREMHGPDYFLYVIVHIK